MELWLVCALLTVVCYGVGEGLSKEPTVRLGSARMLVLYAMGSAPIYAAWFILGSGWERLTPIGMALAIASATCGCFGTIFWFRAMESGTASVVSGFTAAYPVITVAAAVVILGVSLVPVQIVAIAFLLGTIFWFRAMESGTASVVSGFTAAYPVITVAAAVVILGVSLVPVQIVAIAFLLIGAVVLGLHDHPGEAAVGRAWLAPMLLAVILWGAWGILERMSIDALGFAGNAGVYVLVSTPIYLAVVRRGLRENGSWDRAGIREAIPSLFLFSIAGITIFLAIGLGPIAIVVPLTTAYPIVAILVRRFWMDERLTLPQQFRRGLRENGSWDRAGIREAIPSLFLFSIAGITIFLAIGLGPIAIVVPLTTAYPIVAILVRRFWMDERLTLPQQFAIALAMVGAFLATL